MIRQLYYCPNLAHRRRLPSKLARFGIGRIVKDENPASASARRRVRRGAANAAARAGVSLPDGAGPRYLAERLQRQGGGGRISEYRLQPLPAFRSGIEPVSERIRAAGRP